MGGSTPYRYTWDVNGNRTSRKAGQEPIEAGANYDAQERLLTWAGATFTHNAMGQRTAVVGGPDGDWTYTYDIFGNLLRAQQAGGDDVEYVVNASNQRIGRRVNGGPWTWWFYGGGLTPIAEYDADFRLRKVFVYGPGHAPDHVVTYDAAGVHTGRYRFVTDQVGSVLGLVDGGGAWVLEYDYTPFGRRTLLSAAAGVDESLVPFGFASGLHDPTTGLVRFGARDYDPWTARWMAKDPIDFAGGDTNLYAYVGGDPVNFIDPTGLYPTDQDLIFYSEYPIPTNFGDGVSSWVKLAVGEVAMFAAGGGVFSAARWAWRVAKLARSGRAACALDTNAIIAAIEGGRAAELLAGRIPLISITAAKEFLEHGSADVLRRFLAANGGRIGRAGDNALVAGLQQQATALGRVLHASDAQVVASALREGAPLITQDKRLLRLMRAIGVAVETF